MVKRHEKEALLSIFLTPEYMLSTIRNWLLTDIFYKSHCELDF